MKEIQLKQLEKSFEDGLLSKEEYNKKKKEYEEIPEPKREDEPVKEVNLKSDKTLIVMSILLILVFAAILGSKYFTTESPKTIDELHELNLKGKLNEEQGFLYNKAFSFVKFDDLWYTQLVSPKGTRFYNIQFRYSPKEVEHIKMEGTLNTELFNDAEQYYVTFNPTGKDFSKVTLAVADYNQQMTNIFFKQPIAACDRNETLSCIERPIITCDNTNDLVLYVKESNISRVYFDDNCIVVEGSGFDLVKGIDRVLYDFYGIIK